MSKYDDRVTFNTMYYPVFKSIRNNLEDLHILLAPDEQCRKVFRDIPSIGFKNGKILKNHLVKSVLPKVDVADNSVPCGGKRSRWELCKLMIEISFFKQRSSDEMYHIHKPLNCNFKNPIYLIEYNQCWKQYTDSSKSKFLYRVNNDKSTHHKFKNKKQVPKVALKQKIFHEQYCSDDHSGIQDWVITLIEQVDEDKCFRQRELFWTQKLDKFYQNGLNQRDLCSLFWVI